MVGSGMRSSVEVLALKSPTLPPATTTNCYFLGDKDFAIVDPASPWEEQQQCLLDALEERARLGRTAASILLTHHHNDHVGGVNALRAETGLPVFAHPRTAELLAGQIAIDGVLNEGDSVQTGSARWECYHTPGHASGHLCFFNRETGELIIGDMMAGEGTIVLDPPEGDLLAYLQSLARLRDLGSRICYPAHGPALTSPTRDFQQYIDHREMRTRQVRELVAQQSPVKPEDLVEVIYAELPRLFWPIAARQMLCHLQYLVSIGEIKTSDAGFESCVGDGNVE